MAKVRITERELSDLLYIDGATHQMSYGLNGRLHKQSYGTSAELGRLSYEGLLERCKTVCIQTCRSEKWVGKSTEEQLAETPTGEGSVFYECMHELMKRYETYCLPIRRQELASKDERFKIRVEV